MSKKTSQKKELRRKQRRLKRTQQKTRAQVKNISDEQIFTKIEEILTTYCATDVCIALNVAEMWMPNIASQVKFTFLYRVFASIDNSKFNATQKITSYQEFSSFFDALRKELPKFPVSEDYVPELDWGAVKYERSGKLWSIFYGCSLEIPFDYIAAHYIFHKNGSAAHDDMDNALRLHDFFIASIDGDKTGNVDDIIPGHLEASSEAFWNVCKNTILNISDLLKSEIIFNSELFVEIGKCTKIKSLQQLQNEIIYGKALPYVAINIDDKSFPISIRNIPAAIIDFWHSRGKQNIEFEYIENIYHFLKSRLTPTSIPLGLFKLVTEKHVLKSVFSCIIQSKDIVYFVLPIHESQISELGSIESSIQKTLTEGEWGFIQPYHTTAIQIRDDNGELIPFSKLHIIAVISRTGTSPMQARIPKFSGSLMSLPEFLFIFDSLEKIEEYQNYLNFIKSQENTLQVHITGVTDFFAAFKMSFGELVGGALPPHMIWIDPHMGSNWRFKELSDFWAVSPKTFPSYPARMWQIKEKEKPPLVLLSQAIPAGGYVAQIHDTTLHFAFPVESGISVENGNLIQQIAHCLADSALLRKDVIQSNKLFDSDNFTTIFYADRTCLIDKYHLEYGNKDKALFSIRTGKQDDHFTRANLHLDVNIQRIASKMNEAKDAKFEAEALIEWMRFACEILGVEFPESEILDLEQTATWPPRFVYNAVELPFDVPEYVTPIIPSESSYKKARKELAVVFHKAGVAPGTYKLEDAKQKIDIARDFYRDLIREKLERFSKIELLRFFVGQIDKLISKNWQDEKLINLSLMHEVDYDRANNLAEMKHNFVRETRNNRYLLESILSSISGKEDLLDEQEMADIIANADWLSVLYNASDVIHNDIEVTELIIDDDFVPAVTYSEKRNIIEDAYGKERAESLLGIGIVKTDPVNINNVFEQTISAIDSAFIKDVGFSLSHLNEGLALLSFWQHCKKIEVPSSVYESTHEELVETFLGEIPNISWEQSSNLVNFLTLDPNSIRKLIGREQVEADVPIWEQNKRAHRLTIRPVIPVGEKLIWGAATASSSANIWLGEIFDGYLPADFPWPNARVAVRNIKEYLEKTLEKKSAEICKRFFHYAEDSVDFKKRFPKELFEDVGDYDVLSYAPSTNTWLIVECKYNQPPFCIKDARRLRERIFGIADDKGQFAKIERRRGFLLANRHKIAKLLGWPDAHSSQPEILEIYVCRDIYWWMRNPPYDIPTHFVQVDGLDYFLRQRFVTPS